jgi:hypothetical protein
MAVLALAEAFARGTATEGCIATEQLTALFTKAAGSGKENNRSKETLQAAQQCFKAAQQRFAEPTADAGSLAQTVTLARASLAAVAALSPVTSQQQLATWRYNFARRLVSHKAFADAHAEAWQLFQHLNKPLNGSGKGGSKAAADGATADTANMAVGTALTLLLCCIEGGLLHNSEPLQGMLQAAGRLPGLLRWVVGTLINSCFQILLPPACLQPTRHRRLTNLRVHMLQ